MVQRESELCVDAMSSKHVFELIQMLLNFIISENPEIRTRNL